MYEIKSKLWAKQKPKDTFIIIINSHINETDISRRVVTVDTNNEVKTSAGVAVHHIFPWGTYITKTICSPLTANNWAKICLVVSYNNETIGVSQLQCLKLSWGLHYVVFIWACCCKYIWICGVALISDWLKQTHIYSRRWGILALLFCEIL